MDVSAIPRPHSTQQRPTQQYYVPRRIIECGRGPLSKNETNKKKDEKAAPSSVPRSPKSAAATPPTPKYHNQQQQQQKPRPLMEHILAPPPSLRHQQQQQQQQQHHHQKEKSPTAKKEVKFTPATKKPTSTASSRSSSSMSVSPTTPTTAAHATIIHTNNVANGVTKSTPRVLRPQKYAKNPFTPTVSSVSHECNCDRGNTHIMCRRCGYECVGRVQQTCGVHPLIIALNDLRECPNSVCRSTQILELDISELHDQLIEQLAEPIHKIDLLADD